MSENIMEKSWTESLQASQLSIERVFALRNHTPQELLDRGKVYRDKYLSRNEKILLGIWTFVDGELKAEVGYRSAITVGAIEIVIPLNIGERGYIDIQCCNETDDEIPIPIPDRVELSIYEHNIWLCSGCGRWWVFRNMAASAEGDE